MLEQNIKKYRMQKGLTQEEVASRLHVTRQTISKWEKGYSVPDAELLVRLAETLEVDTSTLLGAQATAPQGASADAYAEQLAHIAEQMAIRNRRSKTIWKTVGIVFAVIVGLNLLLTILGVASFSAQKQTPDVRVEIQESADGF